MKDISKELLKAGDVGQLNGFKFRAELRSKPSDCVRCYFNPGMYIKECKMSECGEISNSNAVYFVRHK